jgi:hypothetical protein
MNVLEAVSRAGEILKAAGFELQKVSMKSEACYYGLPGRHGSLRVSTHRNRRGTIGNDTTIATLTFHGNGIVGEPGFMICSEEKFQHMLVVAIGQYWLRSAQPKPSRYQGKRGTWEDESNTPRLRNDTPSQLPR